MIDGYIHIELGDYSIEWIEQFVNQAFRMQLDGYQWIFTCLNPDYEYER